MPLEAHRLLSLRLCFANLLNRTTVPRDDRLSCLTGGQRTTAGRINLLIRRAELTDAETSMTAANDLAVRRALEAAGVEFIDENGGGPGVRLRKSGKEKPRK